MLDSNQIEHELMHRGFTLNVDNTHARGFHRSDQEHLIYVKSTRKIKSDPLIALVKQPLVLHWSVEKAPGFLELANLAPALTKNYCNHNMRGFTGEYGEKPYGIAIDIDSGLMLDKVLRLVAIVKTGPPSALDDIVSNEVQLGKLSETTRKAVVDARLGQGKFRRDLEGYWSCCAITGCTAMKMLRASHIKPWRDSNNTDRLNPYNGLLLTANLDVAFDQGLISFDEHGNILINSSKLTNEDLGHIAITPGMRLRHIEAAHQPFLAEHRRMHQFEK